MSLSHGMDPQQVREIARTLRHDSHELQTIERLAAKAIAALQWHGPDVEAFRDQWSGVGRPAFAAAALSLDEMSLALVAEADQQDGASSASAGGVALGAPGAPAGASGGSGDDDGWLRGLGDLAGDLWDWGSEKAGDVADAIAKGAATAGDGLSMVFGGGLSLIGHGISFVEGVAHQGLSWVAAGVEWGTDVAGGALSGLGNGAGWVLDRLGLHGAAADVRSIAGGIGDRIEAVGDAIPRLVDSVDTFVGSLANPLAQGRLPTVTEVLAGALLVGGNVVGVTANAISGRDLHVLDDGTANAGPPVPVNPATVTDPTDLASIVRSVQDADAARPSSGGNVRITAVTQNGQTAYIVSVPGTSDWAPTTGAQSPLDLTANLVAMSGSQSASQQAVVMAMANAGIPHDAPVLLVGHSQGGIITSHLAADPAFMAQYNVTNMVTFGSPIQTVNVDPRVQVLALQHTTDIVPKLDLGGLPLVLPTPMTGYGDNVHQVTLDNVAGPLSFGANHAGAGYVQSIQTATGRDYTDLMGYQNSAGMQPFLAGSGATVSAVDVTIGRDVVND